MPKVVKKRCKNCIAYHSGTGTCRDKSPEGVMETGEFIAKWPVINEPRDSWCIKGYSQRGAKRAGSVDTDDFLNEDMTDDDYLSENIVGSEAFAAIGNIPEESASVDPAAFAALSNMPESPAMVVHGPGPAPPPEPEDTPAQSMETVQVQEKPEPEPVPEPEPKIQPSIDPNEDKPF